ncbi:MAG: thiamine pyrophosphate-binding protein [Opitutus sp.]
MKLTDYVVHFLADRGVRHIFGLTGGAVVHLFDSADRSGRLQPIFLHHEQGAAFAAQAYARANGTLGACIVTTGPGVTNALSGLAAAWLDSVPCIYISGQARLTHTLQGKKIRQIGTQHIEVLPLVRSMTKYAVLVEDAESIRYHLEKAFHLATTGRPGPVWIDLPLDLQWADIDPQTIRAFVPDLADLPQHLAPLADLATCVEWLERSERPLVLAGYGVSLAKARNEFAELIERYDLPFVTTWGAVDIIPSTHPNNLGRPGIAGQRGANLAIQNCDLLLALGSHLCIPVTGTMFKSFARSARIVMVDIDPHELAERTIPAHLPIAADVKAFIGQLLSRVPSSSRFCTDSWRVACRLYRDRYLAPPPAAVDAISPYDFVKRLSDLSADDDVIVVDGGGTNVYISFQTFAIKGRQRMILSTGLCAMGSGLPESVGAHYGSGGRRVICLCGDGSLQLNIQELQTIRHHQLPIKIFVCDNAGYLSIRGTQKEFLAGNYVGSQASGGVSLPDYTKVAAAYGIPAFSINRLENLSNDLSKALALSGPAVCVVRCLPDQEIIPRQGFDRKSDGSFAPRPLEDMAPFLARAEFHEAMQIPPWNPAEL